MLYSIPASQSLATELAHWVLGRYGDRPEELTKILIFLPTRRAIRGLREAFLRASAGKALLLPQMVSIADIDESVILRHASLSDTALQQAIQWAQVESPLSRLLQMQQLVWKYGKQSFPQLHGQDAACDLAADLLSLFDEVEREGGDWEKLAEIIPEELAEHWQQNLEFLKIVTHHWPQIEQAKGASSPWQKRNGLIGLLCDGWQQNPVQSPVILAGITQSFPALLQLAQTINQLPQGHLFWPDLQAEMIGQTLPESHPQALFAPMIDALEIQPDALEVMREVTSVSLDSRSEWLAQAMIPANQIEQWQAIKTPSIFQEDVENFKALALENNVQTAMTAAILLRETLEIPNVTAALITPDRELARATVAHLKRWQIEVDDSAGQPLVQTPQMIFLFLLLDNLAGKAFESPVLLLSLLKHPLLRIGNAASDIRNEVRAFEKKVLRGITAENWHANKAEFVKDYPLIEAFLAQCGELNLTQSAPLKTWMSSLTTLINILSQSEENKPLFWEGESAQEVSDFFVECEQAESGLFALHELRGILQSLMQGRAVRARYGKHPRIAILSPNEARLQRFDRVILADMNEENWPSSASQNSWLNRAMIAAIGLPSADRAIAQQAHDFVQQAASGEVFMLRTRKSAGAETVASRFWQRLNAVGKLLCDDAAFSSWKQHPALDWAKLSLAPQAVAAAKRPQPIPPLEARPRKLSVTRLEKLAVDPYSIYAQKIIRLQPDDPLELEPSHKEYGTLVHDAIERSKKGEGSVVQCAQVIMNDAHYATATQALWLPRIVTLQAWLDQLATDSDIAAELSEATGIWEISAPAGSFRVTAKADRLQVTHSGALSVIDYKTGSPAPKKWRTSGLAGQLPFTALIAIYGGFADLPQIHSVERLQYWKLGGSTGGVKKDFLPPKNNPLEEIISDADEAIHTLIAKFDNPKQPYSCYENYQFIPRYNDYDHLARVAEWLD